MKIFASFHIVTIIRDESLLIPRNGDKQGKELDIKEAYANDIFDTEAFNQESKAGMEKLIEQKFAFMAERENVKVKAKATMLHFTVLPEVAEAKPLITEVKG